MAVVKTLPYVELKPWETSEGALVVQIIYQDFLNDLAGFDHVLGEVVFPLSELVSCADVSGWFPVIDTEKMTATHEGHAADGENAAQTNYGEGKPNAPCVFVSATWKHPQTRKEPSDIEREVSVAVQEELVRSVSVAKNKAFDIVESSVGALNTALGTLRRKYSW